MIFSYINKYKPNIDSRFDHPVSLAGAETVTGEFQRYINLSARRYTDIFCNPNTSHPR